MTRNRRHDTEPQVQHNHIRRLVPLGLGLSDHDDPVRNRQRTVSDGRHPRLARETIGHLAVARERLHLNQSINYHPQAPADGWQV